MICFSKQIFTVRKISHRLEEPRRTCCITRRYISVSSTSPLAVYAVTQLRCVTFLDKFALSIVSSGKTTSRLAYFSLPHIFCHLSLFGRHVTSLNQGPSSLGWKTLGTRLEMLQPQDSFQICGGLGMTLKPRYNALTKFLQVSSWNRKPISAWAKMSHCHRWLQWWRKREILRKELKWFNWNSCIWAEDWKKGLKVSRLSLKTSRVEHITEIICIEVVITLNSNRQIIPIVLNKESESISQRAFLRQKKKTDKQRTQIIP